MSFSSALNISQSTSMELPYQTMLSVLHTTVLIPNYTNQFNNTSIQAFPGPQAACYPPISILEMVLFTIAYIVVFIMSIGGNAVIIYIVCCYRNIKTAFNILIVNMAVADILNSLVACPMSIGYVLVGPMLPHGTLGLALCKISPFLMDISISASVLTLTVIAVDRYFAIVHVLRTPMGVRGVRRAIAAIWLCSAVLFSYNFYSWRNFPRADGKGTYCGMYWADDNKELAKALYTADALVKLLLHYTIPLFAMVIFYTIILLHLWQRKAPGELADNHQRRLERQKRKIIKMLVTIVTVFALCWFPAHLTNGLLTFNWAVFKCALPPGVHVFLLLVAHANAAINPCLYLIFNQNFRDGMKHLYNKVLNKNVTLVERTSTTRDVISGATAIPNIGYHPSTPQLTRLNTSSSCDEVADSRL